MSSATVRFRVVAAIVAAIVMPGAAQAQYVGLDIGAVSVSARHDLLGDPLMGLAAGVRWGPWSDRVMFRLGAERLVGGADRTGPVCGFPVAPDTCLPEPLRDDARLVDADGGVAVRVFARGRAVLALTGDLTLASVKADTRGLTSGGALSASRALWGWRMGAEGRWTLGHLAPLALELEAAVGRLAPPSREYKLDGYTPFEESFRLTRVRVGLAWVRALR